MKQYETHTGEEVNTRNVQKGGCSHKRGLQGGGEENTKERNCTLKWMNLYQNCPEPRV